MKKVKIYTIHYNRPEFIQWQYDSFRCHLKDEFEYIVVNNARDPGIRDEINAIAKIVGIECIETFSNAILSGKHHADSFNFIWKNYASKDDYVIMMDGDCFLIKEFSVNSFMKNYILAGPKQQREFKYHYLTPTIIIADINNLLDVKTIDWEGIGVIENGKEVRLDSGGGLHNYYQKHSELKYQTKELKSSWHITSENKNLHCIPNSLLDEYNEDWCIEFFGNEFLHYCRSSNWLVKSQEHHDQKSEFVKKFIYATIDGSIIPLEHNFQIDNNIYFGWGK